MIHVGLAEDDSYIQRHLIEIIDAQPDMEVACIASSGQILVDAIDTTDVDVVISDVEMKSREDGIIAAKQILLFYPHIRIIFLSVHDDSATILNAFEANAVDYMLKSASEETILTSIRNAYKNCSPISSFAAEKLRSEYNRLKQNENSLLYFLNIVFMLSPSERHIIQLLMDGYKVREIAVQRGVEISTVKTQITTLLKKFDAKRTNDIIMSLKDLGLEDLFRNMRLE